MKATKALRRLTKIDSLLSDVTDRYSGSSKILESLRVAKAAIVEAMAAAKAISGMPVTKRTAVEVAASKMVPGEVARKAGPEKAARKPRKKATRKRATATTSAATKA